MLILLIYQSDMFYDSQWKLIEYLLQEKFDEAIAMELTWLLCQILKSNISDSRYI